MEQKRIKLIITFLFGLGMFALQAQETVPVSGGNTSRSRGSVSYSCGSCL